MKWVKKYLQYRKRRKQQKMIETRLLIKQVMIDVNNHIDRMNSQN